MEGTASRTTIARAVSLALTGLLALGAATTAQEDTPALDESTRLTAPAFEWQRTAKLPGLAKLVKQGCPINLEDAIFTVSGRRVVSSSDMFGMCEGVNVWASSDGSTWDQEKLKAQRATALASDGSDLIVAGSAPGKKTQDGVVWAASLDGGGLKEVARTKNATIYDVLATPSGYVAIGSTGLKQGYGFPTVWTSEDGRVWGDPVRLDEKRGGFPTGAVDGNGVRLIVDSNRRDGLIWRSEDGVTWNGLIIPNEIRGKRDVSFWPVAALDTGFVMGVSGVVKGQKGTQLWHSPDGREWTPVAETGGWLSPFVSSPQGVFVSLAPPTDKQGRAKEGVPGKMLWSEDGTSWCRLQLDDLAGIQVTSMASGPEGHLLVAGAVGRSFSGTPTVLQGTPMDAGVPCTPLAVPAAPSTTVTFGAPVIEPPSMVAACSDGEARAAADPSMRCVSDLIASGSKKVKPSKALRAAPGSFAKSACVKPAGGTTEDRALLCLYEIAYTWRDRQRQADADGLVTSKAFDKVLPMYQWAASNLSKQDKDYLDRGLSKLDRMPLGWERSATKKLKKANVVRTAPARNASPAALRNTLKAAWLQSDMAPIPDPLVEMPGGWDAPDLPSGYFGPGSPTDGLSYFLGPRGGTVPQTGLVSKCELALDPVKIKNVSGTIRNSSCGVAAAQAWLLYLATGDERFIDLATGIRDMALRASSTEGYRGGAKAKEQLFFETFDCWIGKGSDQGCPSGL